MKKSNTSEAIRYAVYFVVHQSTVRGVAQHFGISKTHVHNVLSKMEEQNFKYEGNKMLAAAVRELLAKNKRERHIRGGNATKLKYMKEQENKQ